MSTTATKKHVKTWFPVRQGKAHERTLAQQMVGLRPLVDEFRMCARRGRPLSVLDVGCAEGLIGMEMLKAGASRLHGVELVPERVRDAKRIAANDPRCTFDVEDAGIYKPSGTYDVVMALSILHKLPDPSAALRRLVENVCDRMVVIRLPPGGPVVSDRRSGFYEHDLGAVLSSLGFNLEEETEGHLGEWIGFWRAKKWIR
jgi:2-polyprenyl-3-methyl-5-hydroxy-6-metoxy-1,4-benzoquinol methylase